MCYYNKTVFDIYLTKLAFNSPEEKFLYRQYIILYKKSYVAQDRTEVE